MRFVTSRIHQWARQFDEAEKAWHELRWGRVAEALSILDRIVRQWHRSNTKEADPMRRDRCPACSYLLLQGRAQPPAWAGKCRGGGGRFKNPGGRNRGAAAAKKC